jgi:hypothetical protein
VFLSFLFFTLSCRGKGAALWLSRRLLPAFIGVPLSCCIRFFLLRSGFFFLSSLCLWRVLYSSILPPYLFIYLIPFFCTQHHALPSLLVALDSCGFHLTLGACRVTRFFFLGGGALPVLYELVCVFVRFSLCVRVSCCCLSCFFHEEKKPVRDEGN